ncbi:hypothetical protein RY831_03290 [Noviherbaspirillum sp. CPCC 100848]|uniref:Uncharacterized protein n=1 Tax=Noviherbaspirillum album TaxID=3080276 RepID=A0ABU6J3G5_9BURK|nr:hypothetical protein [Noviherbaspirillum sp. CPCC 100848]MEC4718157.1 hypothetical protein [Noviherbaspirillum sp. CPCC 100848]
MMELSSYHLQLAITEALRASRDWIELSRDEIQITNSLKSSMFCTQIGKQLAPYFKNGTTKRQITVSEDNGERVGGEWLLDIVWTEDERRDAGEHRGLMPRRIRCAVECESSTSGHEFFKDFAKLLNVRSSTKIFLGGLNQLTEAAAEDYMVRRVREASQYVRDYDGNSDGTNWYIGFWPSPKGTVTSSLWDTLDSMPHLTRANVYHYDVQEKKFMQYTPSVATADLA